MRHALLAALIGLAALATGCATTKPDPNYSAYVQFVEKQQASEEKRFTSLASAAESCTDARCVENVTALAAMAAVARGNSAPQLRPFTRQRSAAENIALGVLGALPGLGQVWATVEAGRNGVEMARINAEREVGLAAEWGSTTRGVADAFSNLPPSISVGRDYITGSQHIGDSVGRDQIGGDQHVGDAIGRDVIGGDRIDNRGNIGTENRIDSPGPFEHDGDRCIGDNCQGLPPPDPEPTPEPEPDPEG